ncbi:hypothetical protein [Hymenobacter sp. CRA2]|uniref:hypothetical protein n=1 Tax=Hymenobacter sp. CRA2 TaxID=1955620 RepID=UPI0011163F18|nr:hypothetical protein [Hymenobacter sp. CRA2]
MVRVLSLCAVYLLLPNLVFGSNQMEAIALGEMMPLIMASLALLLALLVGGIWATLVDFRSPRDNPRPVTVFFIVVAWLVGFFITWLRRNEDGNIALPNVFSELYVPLAFLLIAVKKLRHDSSRPTASRWLILAAACLLVPALSLNGLLQHASAYVLLTLPLLGLWWGYFAKFNKHIITPKETNLDAWQIPLFASTLAVLYNTFLLLFRVAEMRGSPGPFLLKQIIVWSICFVIGLIASQPILWNPSDRNASVDS